MPAPTCYGRRQAGGPVPRRPRAGQGAEPPSGGLAGAAAGPLARLHQLGAPTRRTSSDWRQPEQAQGRAARRPLAAGGAPVLRPMRLSHGHLLPQQRRGTCATTARRLRSTTAEPPASRSAARTLDALRHRPHARGAAPSAIEVSLQLAEDVELERAQRHRQWALRLERARYEVERAERQYDARRAGEPAGRAHAGAALGGGAGRPRPGSRPSTPGSWPASRRS